MTKRYIPRWLYTEATILASTAPAGTTNWIKIPPGTLRNDTIWPMQLEYLCVAGYPTFVDGNNTPGVGIGDTIFAEIGISQEGDINVVTAMLNGTFSCVHKADLQHQVTHPGFTHHFKYPYRLSRDNAFLVRRRGREDLIDTGGIDATNVLKVGVGIIFRGVDVVTGKPVLFAGNTNNRLGTIISEMTFDCADLENRGVHDVDVYSMTVDCDNVPDRVTGLDTGPSGISPSFLVNPLLGERWMPGEVEIPIGCLAPYGCMGWHPLTGPQEVGPHTFCFEEGTYLNRRQEIALRLSRSFYNYNQTVQVALLGYLEVE